MAATFCAEETKDQILESTIPFKDTAGSKMILVKSGESYFPDWIFVSLCAFLAAFAVKLTTKLSKAAQRSQSRDIIILLDLQILPQLLQNILWYLL